MKTNDAFKKIETMIFNLNMKMDLLLEDLSKLSSKLDSVSNDLTEVKKTIDNAEAKKMPGFPNPLPPYTTPFTPQKTTPAYPPIWITPPSPSISSMGFMSQNNNNSYFENLGTNDDIVFKQ